MKIKKRINLQAKKKGKNDNNKSIMIQKNYSKAITTKSLFFHFLLQNHFLLLAMQIQLKKAKKKMMQFNCLKY